MPPAQTSAKPGDLAPFFYGMAGNGGYHSSEDQIGRPAVLILTARLAPGVVMPLLAAFAQVAPTLAQAGADVVVLASASPQWLGVDLPEPSVKLVHCPSDAAFSAAGCGGAQPVVLVTDRSLRVLERIEGLEPNETAARALRRLTALPRRPARTVCAPAPLLIVPDLIDAEFRRTLIDHFEASAHVAGAMASVDAAGQAGNRIDPAKKHRRDGMLEPGGPLHAAVLDALDRRLLPEIKKAFQVDIAHIDRVLIARYDDTGGYFRRHRDNTAAHVAFRQFALSLNLNTGDYEGGELRFPEFSDDGYSPPAGAACVFSASLLHEATPVTRGRRYVLLSFLHDDAAEARRQASLAQGAQAAA